MRPIRTVPHPRLLPILALGALSLASVTVAAPASADAPGAIRFAPTASYPSGPAPQQVAVADFDGDGHLDMVTANWGSNTVSLLRGRGDGTFAPPTSIRAGLARPLSIVAADMNTDGHADFVTVNGRRLDRVSVSLGDGSGGFSSASYRAGDRPQWLTLGDFNGDGTFDVATADAGGGVSVLLGAGDGTLLPRAGYPTGSTMCSAVAAADLNGDGDLDLVTTNSVLGNGMSNHSISILLGNGDGTFGRPDVYRHLGYQPTMATTADLNGDGALDVIAPMGGWPGHYVTVLFGTGDGTFGQPALVRAGASAHDTVAVDLNGDGAVDLASSGLGTSYVVPTNQGIAIRAGNANGRFQPIQRITDAWPSGTWAWPTWIGAADLNADGRIDLIAPDEWTDTIGVLINRS